MKKFNVSILFVIVGVVSMPAFIQKTNKPLNENNFFTNRLIQEEKIIKACDAHKHIGEEGIVVGKVVGAYRSKQNNIFLNFENTYPNHCFTAVILSKSLQNFNSFNEKSLLEKNVSVSGFIKNYNGKPEIIVKYSDQIKVVE
jgi:DNA/RNA endonuclease YhcR with UshA esterase domain